MKKNLLLAWFFLIPSLVFAQFAVVSTQPANNSKNVPLTATVSVTFNEPIDTVAMNMNGNEAWFSNLDQPVSSGYSPDQKTTFSTFNLQANTSYFVAFIYVKAKSGAVMSTPYVYYFTTGADFAPYTVSGTVLSGSSGVLPEGSIVALANVNIMQDQGKEGPPPFSGWTNVNSNGTFSVPYMSNGTYWPIAVKDVDHDGRINPDYGVDVIAFGDSIIVNNASISNLNLTFMSFKPKTFHESIAIADSLAKDLPADKSLRRISAWDVDTTGTSRSWEYAYMVNNNTQGIGIRIQSSGSDISNLDEGYIDWMRQLKEVTNYRTAATSATVIANAEAAGGKAFRLQPRADTIELRIELSISDQKHSRFGYFGFDTSKIYWTAEYSQQYQISDSQSTTIKGLYFLCDLATGAVILTQPMSVKEGLPIPEHFSLSQNYPNPFNPSTNIKFTIPSSNFTTLKVYDMLGKEIAVLINEKKDAGEYIVPFNGAGLTSGIYFYQLRSGTFHRTMKMLLIK